MTKSKPVSNLIDSFVYIVNKRSYLITWRPTWGTGCRRRTLVFSSITSMSTTESEDNLKRLRATRSGNRGVATKYTKEAIELLKNGDVETKDRLLTIANFLNEKIERLKELDAQVLELCAITDIEREIEETEEIFSLACDVSREITKFTDQVDKGTETPVPVKETTKAKQTTTVVNVESNSETNVVEMSINQTSKESSSNSTASEIKHSSTRTKLPKLVLQKFKGDLTRYRTFWETFESAVHKNTELTTVDKLNYLFSLLEGQALRAIKGLAITESNYQAAIDILHERFGKSQQIISGLMDELLKIPPCIGDKASQLRFVYDKLNVNVRGLETLGVKSDQYGSLLILVIMAKLPSDVRPQVARKAKKDVWEIGELLEIIRK